MINYRKATLKDIESVADLMAKLHVEYKKYSREKLLKEVSLLMKTNVFFVATISAKIVGYVYGAIRKDYVEGSKQETGLSKVGYIESIFVLPKYRNHGIARGLCNKLEDWSKSKGAIEFASDAYMSNKKSRAFHKALGFEESKPIVHFIKKI